MLHHIQTVGCFVISADGGTAACTSAALPWKYESAGAFLVALCSAPVGFLRVQSIQNPCSILVMLSGNVLFGNIAEGSETTAILKNNNRAIVTLKHFEEMLYVEDSISSQLFKFEEPKGEFNKHDLKSQRTTDYRRISSSDVCTVVLVVLSRPACVLRMRSGVTFKSCTASRNVDQLAPFSTFWGDFQ